MIDVLVVDDDFYVAKINAHYVSEAPGFRVAGIAHSAAAALAAVERGGVDLVLLDQYLPTGTGLSLTRRIRERDYPIDVIMATADRKPASVQAALRAGVVHYLVKPFTSEVLRRALESYARLRRDLAQTTEFDQQRIDRTMAALRGSRVDHPSPPKGYSERTAELVARVVIDAERQLTAQEAAAKASISRSTAQRYLKLLAESGELRLTLRYGESGRPEHLYSGA